MRLLVCIIAAAIFLSGCHKNKALAGGDIQIYLLKSYELVAGKCQVNPATVILEDMAFVENADILRYNSGTCEYRFTTQAASKFLALPPRTPVAVTLNMKIIFTAINMPAYVSSSCEHSIVITSPVNAPATVQLRLGYPGIVPATGIDDERNNPRLIEALTRQGKLN